VIGSDYVGSCKSKEKKGTNNDIQYIIYYTKDEQHEHQLKPGMNSEAPEAISTTTEGSR
jgi:hypothetical protein